MVKNLYIYLMLVLSLVLLNTGIVFAASNIKLESKSGYICEQFSDSKVVRG